MTKCYDLVRLIEIRAIPAEENHRVPGLAAILLDCVASGASVGFLASLDETRAQSYFAGVFDQVRLGRRHLLGAFLDGQLVGTVQLLLDLPENQPHRAEIAKLLVLRSARGRKLGAQLVEAAEQTAIASAKSLLVLDTAVGGGAQSLYAALGYRLVGIIPNYAQFPDGSPCDTAYYYKQLPYSA